MDRTKEKGKRKIENRKWKMENRKIEKKIVEK